MTQHTPESEVRIRVVKIAFGVMALMLLMTGLVIFVFAEDFGFSEQTAQIIAIAFLVAGVIDCIMLKLWGRIFRHR